MNIRLIDANALKANRQLTSLKGDVFGVRSYVTFDEIDEAPTMPGEPEFLSVKERLPEESGFYLVYESKLDRYEVLFFSSAGRPVDSVPCWLGSPSQDEVTHWMPLPKKPKEG